MVPSHSQAARLAKLNHLRLASPTAVTASLGPVGLLTREADRIGFDMVEAPAGLEIIVTEYDMGPSDSPSFAVSGWGIPSGYGTFDPATEIDEEVLPPALSADGETIAAPLDLRAGIDKDTATTLRIAWSLPPEPGLAIEYQWDVGQDGTFEGRTRTFPATAGVATTTISPGAETLADVRARYIKLTGGVTAFRLLEDVPIDAAIAAPTAPTFTLSGTTPTVNELGDFVQTTAAVTFTASEGVYLIKTYADANVDPPTTQVGEAVFVSAEDVPVSIGIASHEIVLSTDDWNIRVEAVNVSHNSTFSAVETVNITLESGE
jgi:hypothetical protein